jgi:hypothetical protein
MTINFASSPAKAAPPVTTGMPAAEPARIRRLLTLPGLVGIGYSLSWIAGLSVPAPSPKFSASGSQIVAALAGHGPALALQFALTEGLPALGIAVISIALAKAARSHLAPSRLAASRLILIAGGSAAVISFLQFVMGMTLTATTRPATAHLLYAGIDRLDGVKMLALAVLGLTGARAVALPRWLRYTAAALAVAITASGIVYLLLLQSLAVAAGPALVLLLVFITGSGLVLGTKER